MSIDKPAISQNLSNYVLKNGKLNIKNLENIAFGKITQDVQLIDEAQKLLAESLNGNNNWGNIGETLELSTHGEPKKDLQLKFHEIFPVTDDLKIDKSKLSYHAWKDMFPADKYEYSFDFDEDGGMFFEMNPNDESIQNKFSIQSSDGQSILTYVDESGTYKMVVDNDNGEVLQYLTETKGGVDIYDFNSELKFVTFKHFGKGEDIINKEYINGVEFYSDINGVVFDKNVENVISDLDNKNFFGKIDKDKISEDIYNYVNCVNVLHLLTGYAQKTGKNLLQELKTNKLENIYQSIIKDLGIYFKLNTFEPEFVQWLSDDIAEGIKSGDTKKLDADFDIIELLDEEMLDSVLNLFTEDEPNNSGEIAEKMGESYLAPMSDEYLQNNVKPAIGLIGLINSSNLPDKNKGNYIAKLLSNVPESRFYTSVETVKEIINADFSSIVNDKHRYVDDVVTELEEHTKPLEKYFDDLNSGKITSDELFEYFYQNQVDFYKYIIDLKRLGGRNRLEFKHPKTVISPNGKFDRYFKQGRTGDCWLLSGLISMINHDKRFGEDGTQILSNIISINENGDYIVNFKGADKQYTVTKDELKKNKHLAVGDGDVRVLELAVDKYLKEISYALEYTENGIHVDLNDNMTGLLFELILGNFEIEYYDENKHDFNESDKIYSFSVGPFVNSAILEKAGEYVHGNKEIDISLSHGYSITSSDEKYIYVINPWNSSKEIRIERERFKALQPVIEYATVE